MTAPTVDESATFASKSWRDLTSHAAANLCARCQAEFDEDGLYSEDEHREHHQAPVTNESNPLLVAVRAAIAHGATYRDVLEDLDGYQVSYPGADEFDAALESGPTASDAHGAHARKVLTRLAVAS